MKKFEYVDADSPYRLTDLLKEYTKDMRWKLVSVTTHFSGGPLTGDTIWTAFLEWNSHD